MATIDAGNVEPMGPTSSLFSPENSRGMTLTVERGKVYHRWGRVAWSYTYSVHAPSGHVIFCMTQIRELRRQAKRYGITLVEPWKGEVR